MDISIVVPLYNEDESLPELVQWVERVMKANNFSYEMVLVDDGSSDNSWEVIKKIIQVNSAVRGIKFRRNYGKSAAIFCGFSAAEGEVVITMDADLQDSPDEIPDLYKMIMTDGFDMVSGWKQKRYDPLSKTLPSKFFNWLARKVSGIYLHDFNCGLKAYKKKVVKGIEVYGEMHRYMPILAKSAGFKKIGEKVVSHQSRKFGTSKFTGLKRGVNGILDLMSVTFISKFSKRPMHFFGVIGMLMFMFGVFSSIYLLCGKIYSLTHKLPYREITAQPLFFVGLTTIIIGVQLFLAGFIAELVSRSSSERNSYHIEETV